MSDGDELYLVIAARLSSIEAKLDGTMKQLVETALSALSTESRNAADITELRHRVALLEGSLKRDAQPATVPQ